MRSTRIFRSRNRRQLNRRNPFILFAQIAALLSVLFIATTTVALAGSIGSVVAVFNYFTRDLPDFTELDKLGVDVDTTFETTKIYAWGGDEDGDGIRDAKLIYEIIDPLGGDREWLRLDQIPPDVINATVAVEDKSFWTNQGFDLEGIGRAFYQYIVQGGSVQGGSSITQQVVKNNLIEANRRVVGSTVDLEDYQRKLEEMVLSFRISRYYTKEQILEWYLNTNFYGNLAYGIEAASRLYFDKPASQLTLAETAMLVPIPQSPAYNPIDNPEEAKVRQGLVLYALFRDGYIDRETFVQARDEDVTVKSNLENRFDIIAPHFAQYVRQELEHRFGVEQVLRGGLTVYTTLDLIMQTQAECVSRMQIGRLSGQTGQILSAEELARCPALEHLRPLPAADVGVDHHVNNAAVIAIVPRTGEIRAMAGSLDYWNEAIDGSFNVAVDGLRQPGSSFKPFTYITAFSQGYTAATMVQDVETDFGTPYNGIPYVPVDYDRKFRGPMRIRQALGNSYNVPAVEVMSWVGVENVIRTAHHMGLTSLNENSPYGLSLALGGGEVRLIDMVYAYTVFANQGVMVGVTRPADSQQLGFRALDPVSILRVEDRHGNVIYQYSQPGRREIISPQLAFLMNDILSDNKARCQAFGCPNPLELPDGRPTAVKTGTTNNFRDDWTIGYTPQLAVGVWVGNTDNTKMKDLPSYKGAAPIWNAIMTWGLQGEPAIPWLPPPGIVRLKVCDLNGLLPSPSCPTVEEYFIAGTEPKIVDYMYQRLRVNAATGRLATPATPPELVRDEVFTLYPDRSADWVRETGKRQPPTEYDSLTYLSGYAGNAAILAPEPFGFVRGYVNIIGNARAGNFAYYRLAYYDNHYPDNWIDITGAVANPNSGGLLGAWNTTTLADGTYTLVLQVFHTDGSRDEFQTAVTVDNSPPVALITSPFADQEIPTSDEWVAIQAQVADAFAVSQVQFFADNSGTPFAVNTVFPFTKLWMITEPGCHSFYVRAFDEAGNVSVSEPVSACFVKSEEVEEP